MQKSNILKLKSWYKESNIEKAQELLPLLNGLAISDAVQVIDVVRSFLSDYSQIDVGYILKSLKADIEDSSNPPGGPGTPP